MVYALLLTILAGLSTSIGGFLALHKKMLHRGVLATALGFSAGAMIYVSFVEILPKSRASLVAGGMPLENTGWWLLASFLAGIIIVAIIDRVIPSGVNPSETEGLPAKDPKVLTTKEAKALMRGGILVAIALTLHNLPEGLATFIGALEDPALGLTLAIAIAIHNIPEGIAVAAPIYAATKSRTKAFFYTALSGLAEPIGALFGYFILRNVLSDALFGIVFSLVAGMMIFISLDELLPAARRYETSSHQTIYGCVLGMVVMAVSLLLLA